MSLTLNRFLLLAAVALLASGCAMLDGGTMHAPDSKPRHHRPRPRRPRRNSPRLCGTWTSLTRVG